jgi:YD repeat-containing protein
MTPGSTVAVEKVSLGRDRHGVEVFVQWDGQGFVFSKTLDWSGETDTVYIDGPGIGRLIEYIQRIRQAMAQGQR